MIIYRSKLKTEGIHGLDREIIISKEDNKYNLTISNGDYDNIFSSLSDIIRLFKGEEDRLQSYDHRYTDKFKLAAQWMGMMAEEIGQLANQETI